MYIVIYRPHNELNINTKFYGPFVRWEYADDLLCSLPALGIHQPAEDLDNHGVKYIQQLDDPKTAPRS